VVFAYDSWPTPGKLLRELLIGEQVDYYEGAVKEIGADGSKLSSHIGGFATLISKTELTSSNDTPEPATLLLMGPALGWLAWRRRRQGKLKD
jgi:hypothetical protein